MNELDKFTEDLKSYEAQPSGQVWDRLEQRLREKKVRKSLKMYKYLVAASFFGLALVSYAYFDHIYTTHRPGQFATNEQYNFMMVEELDYSTADEGIYALSSIQNVYNAYKNYSPKVIKVNN